MNDWSTQQLRVSVFPTLNYEFDPKIDLWPHFTGIEQEKQTIESKTGAIIYEGFINKNKLILSVTPLKIDLIMMVQAPVRMEEGMPTLEHMGTIRESLAEFKSLVEQWLSNKNLPTINRLAFGGQFARIAESREETYKLLSNYLPFELDPQKMSDFNLQLNLFTKSKIIKDLSINRLSKWVAAKFIPELGIIGNPQVVRKLPTTYFGILELDINTDQENKEELDKTILTNLYSELIEHGVELSQKGIKKNAE